MDIFDYAMEKEKYSENYYREMAGDCGDDGLAYIFNLLADEEIKHYETVRKMKEGAPVILFETKLLKEAKSTFKKMKEAKKKFTFTINQAELYKKAQEFEKKSREFYLQKAEEFETEDYKEIFKQLADEENRHYYLLENIIELVLRPEQGRWLENAEFYHMSEY